MPTIKEVAEDCYLTALRKGWHDKPREFGTDIALIHSELSEALEDARAKGDGENINDTWYEGTKRKPCGVPSELADAVIRIFDTSIKWGIDIEAAILEKMAFNEDRSFRHGGKAF